MNSSRSNVEMPTCLAEDLNFCCENEADNLQSQNSVVTENQNTTVQMVRSDINKTNYETKLNKLYEKLKSLLLKTTFL